MNIWALEASDLSAILDSAFNAVIDSEEWYSAFPKVEGYKYFSPEGYEDIENENTFRGRDHAIAHETVKNPMFHEKIIVLTKFLIVKNVSAPEPILADTYEHAGTCYAVELALHDKKHILLYANFLLSNDIYYERFQHFDFVRIIRKWAWCSETYYLLFAHMFSQSEYFHDDIDYLNYNAYPLHKGLLDDPEETDIFFSSLKLFLEEITFDVKDIELKDFAVKLFDKLVNKHIYPDDEENTTRLNNRFSLLLEELKARKEELEEEVSILEDSSAIPEEDEDLPII